MGLHRRESTKHGRRGAASTSIAFVLLLVCALVVAVVLLSDRPFVSAPPVPAPESSRPTTPGHDAPIAAIESGSRAQKPAVPGYDPLSFGPERFEGRGRVRGEVLTAEGVVFPTVWTLVLEPHPYLTGSERAITKRIEFSAGERTFDVGDLPLGGYRVRPEAQGLNGNEVGALLVKGSSNVYATLEFRSAGIIDGRVLASNGGPADGVEVVLEAKATQLRTSVRADANGRFLLGGVLDGEYRICIGPPESPLLPPGLIGFKAPTLRYPDATLPPTGALSITTHSQDGALLGDVDISGFGSPQGSVRARTGPHARVRVPWLLPGTYKLEGQSLDGRRGRVTADVRVDSESEVDLFVRD